ncbi:hypothetical protein GCM10011414_25690 [Croceivirga lutea]|uniref:hypothetical protein n=1 Tax=Croceivirga lutea TaxID=1775167 RepID=UPI00163A9283|nr:hypothetical protein [Croceivirga lutea]GGG54726.1 hypothetical protein GCM10011414_25690 [Croceivirga lutea]
MRGLLLLISYIFHPLFIPLGGSVAFFLINPLSLDNEQKLRYLFPIFVLTIIIPIIFFFILKSLKLISSAFAPEIEERKYPLALNIIIILLLVFKVLPEYQITELYYFFLGLLLLSLTLLVLLFAKIKASIHMAGMGGLLLFLIGLSIHFEINITIALSIFTLASGLVATSRLYTHAHSKPELLIGFTLGVCSQLFLFKFWL